MNSYKLGIDIGSTTVKIALIDDNNTVIFSDYERHFANIQETLQSLLEKAVASVGNFNCHPVITGSGGLTLAKHLEVPFTQEVVAVSTALQAEAPQCDVAIELGGEDAKIIYFTNGVDQRMNGICAGGTGSFIDQMATLLQTQALMNMQRITNLYILSLQDVEFSQNQTSSLLSTKVQQKKICQLLFFRLLLIRPYQVLHVVSQSVAMLHF